MKRYNDRLEIRIDSQLKKNWKKFCQNLSSSEEARKALLNHITENTLKQAFLKNMQEGSFVNHLQAFLLKAPKDVFTQIENMLGPEEEEYILRTPDRFLAGLGYFIVTQRGKKVLEKRLLEGK